MGRRLDPDEKALWHKVTATVRPIARRSAKAPPVVTAAETPAAPMPAPKRGRVPPIRLPAATPVAQQKPLADGLDGGWDKRIRRGATQPDWTVDLHGHSLDSARRLLDGMLDQAVAEGIRVILLITGKPPREEDRNLDGRPRRGLIRASIGAWLQSSRHAGRIAAVRNAHPRHGGQGALYVILRRVRDGR
ncbi:Smr/MutS family protein [Rhizorhabdus dicambivorans]|uniref:DNA mismatch repair protein MutS n=1 Tax=Rhizorhabdus dicambivorans TaxID=1850238 RepID=A0A2A4FWW0_9SPHN|nr:Smr/MutS family protein [Rhizorhabdus dicambivorans]ATE66898.1 DNA mismatch repair protein MutS [Rhizorhabdus dicambivorans]PCE42232.1 DNA mismatch repair protein MutS [Rhizorhabdus dicambivorans]